MNEDVTDKKKDGPSTSHDLIAGWLGGLAGILLSNPLEVLKVRLQVERSQPFTPSTQSTSSKSAKNGRSTMVSPSIASKTNLSFWSLFRKEGSRVLFVGTAGPIVGLALLDSAFFGGYGIAMNYYSQDRQNPSNLWKVFLSGASSGGVCALLQTPVEVVKCTAQAESSANPRTSLQIARSIAQTKGLRGFYVGGLITAAEDGIGSGIFFATYFWLRKRLRPDDGDKGGELGRILLAGGLAGVIGAIVPYPLDIIKTRLQTRVVANPSAASAAVLASPFETTPPVRTKPSVWSIAKEIYTDSSLLPSNWYRRLRGMGVSKDGAQTWSRRLEGLKGFSRGIQATSISGFVGSAGTITVFEATLMALGNKEGAGGGIG